MMASVFGKPIILLIAVVAIGAIVVAYFYRAPVTPIPDDAFGPASLDLRPVSFDDLIGWRSDNPTDAFNAFMASCEVLLRRDGASPANSQENLGPASPFLTVAGSVEDWRPACDEASKIAADRAAPETIRGFFETRFQPLLVIARQIPLPEGPAKEPKFSEAGKFTGYFEPQYGASRTKTDRFDAPIYTRPDNLIDVDLGAFAPDLKGKRIAGRVDGSRLVPYADHEEINAGGVGGAAEPIAWISANDLFFLQIQGSGQLAFGDGEQMRVGYAAQNGHKYTAIGRVMVEREILPLEEISMQSIRDWLDSAAPDAARELREQNKSYVFFRSLDDLSDTDGPLGAQGVPLTPEVSLAVDRRFHMLGAPVWVDIEPIAEAAAPIRRLMIAQDTGGAIRGPVRGDVFWGAGTKAAENAGIMNAEGRMYIFAPKPLAARILNGASTQSRS